MLSQEEFGKLKELARKGGMTISTLVRFFILKGLEQNEVLKKAKGQGVPPRLASLTDPNPTRMDTNG